MAPSAAQFIHTAFSRSGSFSLSYVHHSLKWLIRSELLSLFNEFPTLSPRASHFTYDDGTTSYLLTATGTIASTPLTIWLPPTYPFVPPFVFVSTTTTSNDNTITIQGHPFVTTTGAVLTPYLLTWRYPSATLVKLARNLDHVLRICPLLLTNTNTSSAIPFNTDLVSKQEAIDRLALALFYDVAGFLSQAHAHLEELFVRQSSLRDRYQLLQDGIIELESERLMVEERIGAMNSQVDKLKNWLDENQAVRRGECEIEKTLACVDDESRVVLESSAADLAIEDVLDELDRALQEGLVGLSVYMKYVRSLAREQFFYRARLAMLQRRFMG